MPIPSPLEPIFKPKVRYGAMAVGISPGSIGAAPSAGVVTASVSTLTPSVTVTNLPTYIDHTIVISGGGTYTGGPNSMSVTAGDFIIGITAWRGFGTNPAPTMTAQAGGVLFTGLATVQASTGFDNVSATNGAAAVYRAEAASTGLMTNGNGGGDNGALHVLYRGATNAAMVQQNFAATDATDNCDISLSSAPSGRVIVLIAYGPTSNGGLDNGPNLQAAAPSGWTKRADHSFTTKGFLCFEANTPQQTFTYTLSGPSGANGGRAVFIAELPV